MKQTKKSALTGILCAVAVVAVLVAAFICNMNGRALSNNFWALLPPVIAIVLALVTKEVYSSLFIGILTGGLLHSGFNLVTTMEHVFVEGMIGTALADTWNVGILIFLVVLGGMVMLMNRAGGSAAVAG